VTAEPITAEVVLSLFEKAWPAAKHPDAFWCGHIAIALGVIRDRRKPPKPKQPDAVAAARRFLDDLPEMRARLESEAAWYFYVDITDGAETVVYTDRERHDRCVAARTALEDAQRAIRASLDAWEDRDPFLFEDQDPARFIWSITQRVLEISDCPVPRSVQNHDDPACKFVAAALAEAGVLTKRKKPPSSGAISKILSGKNKHLSRAPTKSG
jgi:hypothetical protein